METKITRLFSLATLLPLLVALSGCTVQSPQTRISLPPPPPAPPAAPEVQTAPEAWSPVGRPSVFINISGQVVSRAIINTNCHPWGPDGNPGTGDDPADFRPPFACRYAGGASYDEVKGHNPQGFANEAFHLNRTALIKLGVPDPPQELQWDFAVSHTRSCADYGLTLTDGCGSARSDVQGFSEFPDFLISYCRSNFQRNPVPACAPKIGGTCVLSYNRRVGPTGAWVEYDGCREECIPPQPTDAQGDRLYPAADCGEPPPDEPPPDEPPPDEPPPDEPPPDEPSSCQEARDNVIDSLLFILQNCEQGPEVLP